MITSPQNHPSRRTVLTFICATTALARVRPVAVNDLCRTVGIRERQVARRVDRCGKSSQMANVRRLVIRSAAPVAVCDRYLPQIDVLAADNKATESRRFVEALSELRADVRAGESRRGHHRDSGSCAR